MPALEEANSTKYANHCLNQLYHKHQYQGKVDKSKYHENSVRHPLASIISDRYLEESIQEQSVNE
jgi:hypothetical protein